MVSAIVILISAIVAALLVFLLATAVRIISPYEVGLYMFLGKYRGKLHGGLNLVIPFGSRVVRLDLRTQNIDVPRQEVITKDNSPTNVDAIVFLRVVNPEDAFFKVQDYRDATISLAQTNLRSLIGEMDLDDVFSNRETINGKLRVGLDQQTEAWGVKIEAVEIREVDPVERVKRAMEEQTSAEREKRAAIQRATGDREAAILKAQGQREARVLEAKGERESQILRAQGRKEAQTLEAQGQARALQVVGVGALSLDSRALAVLGLQTLGKLGDSPATKFVIPMELTRALQGAAKHYGITEGKETITLSLSDLQKAIPDFDALITRLKSDEKLVAIGDAETAVVRTPRKKDA